MYVQVEYLGSFLEPLMNNSRKLQRPTKSVVIRIISFRSDRGHVFMNYFCVWHDYVCVFFCMCVCVCVTVC